MGRDRPVLGCERDLLFFGTISASLSHQLNNVFTIINEINGLLEDQLDLLGEGRALSPATLTRVAEKTARHVQRGAGYVARLNQLAHSADQPRGSVSLGELLLLAVDLFHRHAELRQSTLEVAPLAEALTVTTSPFHLLQVLFRCVELTLREAGPGAAVTLGAVPSVGQPTVRVTCDRPFAEPAAAAGLGDTLHDLLDHLDAQLALTTRENGVEFQLTLPRDTPAEDAAGGTTDG